MGANFEMKTLKLLEELVRARARATREAELPGLLRCDADSRTQRQPRAAQGELERRRAVLHLLEQLLQAKVPRCIGKLEICVVGLGPALLHYRGDGPVCAT